MSAGVLNSVENGVSWITLNRPEAMNAVTWDQRERIISLLAGASEDAGIRAVVITATGKGFCAGADLRSAPPADGRPGNGSPGTWPGRYGRGRSV